MRFKLIFLFLILFFPACSQKTTVFYPEEDRLQPLDILGAIGEDVQFHGQEILIHNLGKTEGLSSHLVWIKTKENPHFHAEHDGTVLLLRGQGVLKLGKQEITLHPGALVSIPRKVPHFFTNHSSLPALAYVIFSPPFDGKDVVPVETESQP